MTSFHNTNLNLNSFISLFILREHRARGQQEESGQKGRTHPVTRDSHVSSSQYWGGLEGIISKGLKIMEENLGEDNGPPSTLSYGDGRSELGKELA